MRVIAGRFKGRRLKAPKWDGLRPTSDKLRAASAYLVAPVREVTHLVAEPDAPDDLLDPYRALGLSVLRA